MFINTRLKLLNIYKFVVLRLNFILGSNVLLNAKCAIISEKVCATILCKFQLDVLDTLLLFLGQQCCLALCGSRQS